jgi:hypothetical protein
MKQMLHNMMEALDALRNPADANERLVLLEPGTPLQRLMEQLRVGTDGAIPEFDFELADVLTIEGVGRLCREIVVDRVAFPVNLPVMLITAGQRLFFNTNMAAPANYQEVSHSEAADLSCKVAICHFLDGAKTVIDWSESFPELKRLAKNCAYTPEMMKVSLHRLVNRYTPEQSHLISDLSANYIANHMLSTEKNRNKTFFQNVSFISEYSALLQSFGRLLLL